jgi:cytochrome c553
MRPGGKWRRESLRFWAVFPTAKAAQRGKSRTGMGSWTGRGVLSKVLACGALAWAGTALAQQPLHGDPEHGKAISYTCLGCHGIRGYRNAYPNYSVPKLEGQHPEYIVAALQAYKDGERSHTTMHSQASSLSDQDMADIAVFFAGKPLMPSLKSGTAGTGGIPKAAAVCIACHGVDGVGIVPMYPTLAGQHADYLRREIAQYKDGGRRNQVMAGMAAPLTDHDVEEITQYYSSLTPALKTEERPYTRLTVGP